MKSFSVVGLGSFGMALTRALSRLGAQVTAVDNELAHVEAVMDEVHAAVRLDARDRTALSEQGIHRADVAVVCMGEDFEAAELAAVHLLDLGCPRVYVRGTSRERVEILRALGPEVITPAIDAAEDLAALLIAEGLIDYRRFPGDLDVAMVTVPESEEGRILSEFPGGKDVGRPVALQRGKNAGGEVIVGPGDSTVLRAGDFLFFLGTEKELIRLGERIRRVD